tara:strand:+ start:378 stop:788 length:411 start_codon:yes stop_codon:yes gene_type:complete
MIKNFIVFLSFSLIFSQPTIYFVYNANNDFISIIGDFVHKSVSPTTYSCNLCKLSYGIFTKTKKWEAFLNTLEYEFSFIYKNEKTPILNHIDSFPVVLIQYDNQIDILVSTDEMNSYKNLDDMIMGLNKRIANLKK